MSATISSGLATAIAAENTYLCRIWQITLKNGDIYRYTDLIEPVTYGGNTWVHDPGILISALAATGDGSANATIDVIFAESLITEDMIRRGSLDDAAVQVWAIDWSNPSLGTLSLFNGTVGDITWGDKDKARLNLKGTIRSNSNVTGAYYSRQCRATLGDAKCKFNINSTAVAFTITGVSNNQQFNCLDLVGAQADGYYNLGYIQWITGDNAGLYDDIKAYISSTGTITTQLVPRFPVQAGDTGKVFAGCDKAILTCALKFNNTDNFHGEPYAPNPTLNILQNFTDPLSASIAKGALAWGG